MLSRALTLAAVTLLIGGFRADPVLAQVQNLEAGKSPSQIFSGTCTACHKGPRGLLKTVAASSLPGFLRQHYTTSSEMASLLAGFLVSNGAADTRYVGQPKAGKDDKSEPRLGGAPDQLDRFGRRQRSGARQQEAKPEADPREVSKPDTAALPESPQVGRNGPRWTRPADPAGAESQDPAQAANERGPDGRRLSAKQKLSKRAKPGGEDAPKTDAANTEAGKEESPKGEAAQSDTPKSESPKNESPNNETANGEGGKAEGKSEPAKLETSKETGTANASALRADPVPQVTPAPTVSADASGSPGTSAVLSPAQSPPQTLTASAPPPVPPAGPPAPPISR
ncbi:MAG TPA: hypothetical protein VKB08_08425 [Bradyrhizobium sp.]|nr:hypothetical protein [Bradyrhizobium sp.]